MIPANFQTLDYALSQTIHRKVVVYDSLRPVRQGHQLPRFGFVEGHKMKFIHRS